ncbi:MAG: pyridoxal-phosphate dependent enzyme [Nitrososphaerota archaeon]|jgi:threonine synthase|nr:pyridoxal-phosphate dependent enzyme [Nitrososphaerota archaeon]MDG6929792.1 pyridoxal-phosphate dependent enzyme [Nitrososphaerota archaeon]
MFKCYVCGHVQENGGQCSACGNLTVYYPLKYELKKIKATAMRANGIWNYRNLLPPVDRIVSLGEGGTPLIYSEKIRDDLKVGSLMIKNESVNPTGSFLDRGSSVAISYAISSKYRGIKCFSSGNLGASLSAYSAKAGIPCSVYATRKLITGKLYQTMCYGASVNFYDSQQDAVSESQRTLEGFYTTGESDTIFLSGLKTIAYEIFEQTTKLPDYIFVSVGEGGALSMIYSGLVDLKEAGLLGEMPRLVGVRVKNQSAVADDLFAQKINLKAAEKALNESGGFMVEVEDEEILKATAMLAKSEGLFAEPSAAVALAGLYRSSDERKIDQKANVLYVLTGTGLKDPVAIGALIDIRPKRNVAEVQLGKTKKAILEILYSKRSHGYEIWKKLREFEIKGTLPAVYISLSELKRDGLIKGENLTVKGRNIVLYELTDSGKRIAGLLLSM